MKEVLIHPRTALRLWAVYPFLVPFYLMGKTPVPGTEKVQSGVPQLADFYLVGLMAVVFGAVPFRLHRHAVPVVMALSAFVGYVACINGFWAANLENLGLMQSSAYYAYDVMLLCVCLVLHAHFQDDFLRVTTYAVAGSVVLQAILSPLAPQFTYSRQAGFFNDENQLGYFCVLSATIFMLGARRFSIRPGYQLVVYAAIAYLALLAQSRAALLGLAALALITAIRRPWRLLAASAAAVVIYAAMTAAPPVLLGPVARIVASGEYDTAATRGYDRIVNHPEHIVFGAGEGAYERFRSELFASEIHSSYGTLVFCYGVPGTVLFTLALIAICRRRASAAIYLIPAFIHGTGHHGLRFAYFWAMLAFLCCDALSPAPTKAPNADASLPETTPPVCQPNPAT